MQDGHNAADPPEQLHRVALKRHRSSINCFYLPSQKQFEYFIAVVSIVAVEMPLTETCGATTQVAIAIPLTSNFGATNNQPHCFFSFKQCSGALVGLFGVPSLLKNAPLFCRSDEKHK
jgi:hypothetical protein